jgi:hypothetical protein
MYRRCEDKRRVVSVVSHGVPRPAFALFAMVKL